MARAGFDRLPLRVAATPSPWESTFRRIESRVVQLQQDDIAVVSLGGDHSVLLPLLRATHQSYPEFPLIHFDAHADTSTTTGPPPYHHGTCVRNAIEEGLIPGSRIFQIGIRGSFGSASYLDYLERAGINVLDMHGFHDAARRAAFVAALRETAGAGPCYLTFDIDSIDPAFARVRGRWCPVGSRALKRSTCCENYGGCDSSVGTWSKSRQSSTPRLRSPHCSRPRTCYRSQRSSPSAGGIEGAAPATILLPSRKAHP